jgi:L-galactose dehydrogenase/L-glyceraldehyde 3-phosphate reductase
MRYRALGTTGIDVSAIAFGAGPVSQLLTGDPSERQRATLAAAIDCGINWFDTAATYGAGSSEENLGRTLAELGVRSRVHVATKVRVMPDQLGAIGAAVRDSVYGSLRRLRLERVTLVQIHNSITAAAGAEPTSITPDHVLAPGGVLDELAGLQRDGLVEHLGLTGLGEPKALRQVIDSGRFATLQVPYNLLNQSAGRDVAHGTVEADYGNLIGYCAARGLGVLAIRVLAGGALAGRPPSPHTLKTPFFPLDLYQRDCRRAERLTALLPPGMTREEAAVRFALSHAGVASAIVGLGTPDEVAAACRFADAGSLDEPLLDRLNGDF